MAALGEDPIKELSMSAKRLAAHAAGLLQTGMIAGLILQLSFGGTVAAAQSASAGSRDNDTSTPIKHVIVIIGENLSFDHVFATYVPKKGETVNNLLSEGIIKADGTPGANFAKAAQKNATDMTQDAFLLNPQKSDYPDSIMPAPIVGGPSESYVKNNNLKLAKQSENGLPAEYYGFLVTGGSGQTGAGPDARITNRH